MHIIINYYDIIPSTKSKVKYGWFSLSMKTNNKGQVWNLACIQEE